MYESGPMQAILPLSFYDVKPCSYWTKSHLSCISAGQPSPEDTAWCPSRRRCETNEWARNGFAKSATASGGGLLGIEWWENHTVYLFFLSFGGLGGWKEREEKVEWCLVCESGNNWNSCKGGKSFFVSHPSFQHFSTPLKCAYDVGMSVSMRIIATFWHNRYIMCIPKFLAETEKTFTEGR